YIILYYIIYVSMLLWRPPEALSLLEAPSAAVGGWPTVVSTRATREGLRLTPSTRGDAPVTTVDRIGGRNRAGWRWGGGLRGTETPGWVSAAGRVFGLLLSK